MKLNKPKLIFFVATLLVLFGYSWYTNRAREQKIAEVFSTDTRQILEHSQSFILYSLHPRSLEAEAMGLQANPKFHGYTIMGQTEIKH
ncbi:MAG: hypothetical protein ABJA67_03565 [Chthonomonadales bacterium]